MDSQDIDRRLSKIEALLSTLVDQQRDKEFYSTHEAAAALRRDPFTVREWCRLGRVRAVKRNMGRGSKKEWVISHEELTRIQGEGLLLPIHRPV